MCCNVNNKSILSKITRYGKIDIVSATAEGAERAFDAEDEVSRGIFDFEIRINAPLLFDGPNKGPWGRRDIHFLFDKYIYICLIFALF